MPPNHSEKLGIWAGTWRWPLLRSKFGEIMICCFFDERRIFGWSVPVDWVVDLLNWLNMVSPTILLSWVRCEPWWVYGSENCRLKWNVTVNDSRSESPKKRKNVFHFIFLICFWANFLFLTLVQRNCEWVFTGSPELIRQDHILTDRQSGTLHDSWHHIFLMFSRCLTRTWLFFFSFSSLCMFSVLSICASVRICSQR